MHLRLFPNRANPLFDHQHEIKRSVTKSFLAEVDRAQFFEFAQKLVANGELEPESAPAVPASHNRRGPRCEYPDLSRWSKPFSSRMDAPIFRESKYERLL